jgi:hypothetical protein
MRTARSSLTSSGHTTRSKKLGPWAIKASTWRACEASGRVCVSQRGLDIHLAPVQPRIDSMHAAQEVVSSDVMTAQDLLQPGVSALPTVRAEAVAARRQALTSTHRPDLKAGLDELGRLRQWPPHRAAQPRGCARRRPQHPPLAPRAPVTSCSAWPHSWEPALTPPSRGAPAPATR